MNVLYLSYDGMTDPLGQSQVLPYLAGIANAGHKVTLVSFEKPERYVASRETVETICSDAGIDWQPLTYTKRPPVLSTVWDVVNMRRRAAALHREKKFDAVHCRSYIAALVGLWLKRSRGVKFIFDMRGFWADERVEGNLWDLKNPLYKTVYAFFKRKEKEFLSEADCTVSLTQNAKNEIHKWTGVSHQPVPIDVIPCCADMTLFDPNRVADNAKEKLRERLGLGDGFVLSYIGSLGTWYMLDEMLDFFSVLLKHRSDARFLVLTNDRVEDMNTKLQQRRIPSERVVLTNAARNDVPLFISLSDATLFFIRPSYAKKASSPVKQGEAMAMGIPIVCNAGVGDTDAIVGDNGVVISEFSEAAYNRAVVRLLAGGFDASRIRAYALEHLSLDAGVERYLHAYNRLSS